MALLVLGSGLGGCISGLKHNDVLLFGTDTVLALDVSASATSGGTPQITLGYKRQEAVWMPLVVNAQGVNGQLLRPQTCTQAPCPAAIADWKYTGQAETQSAHPGGRDAYSVFASFGADIKGGARADEVSTGVGLAQFFATGIAAQRLAQNSQVVSALSLHGRESGEVAQAAAGLTPEQQRIASKVTEIDQREQLLANRGSSCLRTKGSDSIYSAVPSKSQSDRLKSRLTSAVTPEEWRYLLDDYGDIDFAAALTTAGCPA